MSVECVVWVDIILLYLLTISTNMHERQFLNIRYIFFYFHFHFKPLKNIREELFSFKFMQFATPDSRGIQLF